MATKKKKSKAKKKVSGHKRPPHSVTLSDAARRLSVHRVTLLRAINADEVECIRQPWGLRRVKLYIPRVELQRLLNEGMA